MSLLPEALCNMVIDTLAEDSHKRDVRAALRSCSSVCRLFRQRAQHHIFSKIVLRNAHDDPPSKVINRLRKLRGLIYNCILLPPEIPAESRLVNQIKDLELILVGSAADITTIIKDIELAKVLWEIHKAPDRGLQRFSLNLEGASSPVDWYSFQGFFMSSFSDMMRSPSLSTLCLRNITRVPSGLLCGSTVSRIVFRQLTIQPTRHTLPCNKVEVMDIDASFPACLFLNPDPGSTTAKRSFRESLSHVRELRLSAPGSRGFNHMIQPLSGTFQSLQKLKLSIHAVPLAFRGHFKWNVPYADLPVLKTLEISLEQLVTDKDSTALQTLLTILHQKSPLSPSSITSIRLNLSVTSQQPWKEKSQFFPHDKLWTDLDKILTRAPFALLTSVYINVEYRIGGDILYLFNDKSFKRNCHMLSTEVFPSLLTSAHCNLIRIVPEPLLYMIVGSS